ncbi:MAG TPA: PQQ-dependent sugar dehydrogenase [Myxococcales bacterium]|nr:PQQ-dependent sugar dehydrogenase [Myxococcales bacterium]
MANRVRVHVRVSVQILALFALLAQAAPAPARGALPLERIKLPPGFKIEVYASGVKDARSLALGSQGVVFVGTRRVGRVYALVDSKKANRADQVLAIASGLQMPNGVAFRDGALYVAEISRVLRYSDIETRLESTPRPTVLRADYPDKTHHGWKFIAFGPDGLLYVPVGAPCNVCEPPDRIYESITRLSLDGKTREVFAHGVRNTVGFDWHPRTKVLWFTENGRDDMGDDTPEDELNRAPQPGMHFGFPYCHASGLSDPELGRGRSCSNYTAPAALLGPHVAAVGMRFYTGAMFPPEYRENIFIAEHGSWNRTVPLGYRLKRVRLDEKGEKVVSQEVFASGWLPERPAAGDARRASPQAWGRPVDVLVMPDGALLVSDDAADAVYRISYAPPKG